MIQISGLERGGLSSRWSFIRVVSHQGGLSSGISLDVMSVAHGDREEKPETGFSACILV